MKNERGTHDLLVGLLKGFMCPNRSHDLYRFHSVFGPNFGVQTAVVALLDTLSWERDRESVTLLVPLGVSAAFDTIVLLE